MLEWYYYAEMVFTMLEWVFYPFHTFILHANLRDVLNFNENERVEWVKYPFQPRVITQIPNQKNHDKNLSI